MMQDDETMIPSDDDLDALLQRYQGPGRLQRLLQMNSIPRAHVLLEQQVRQDANVVQYLRSFGPQQPAAATGEAGSTNGELLLLQQQSCCSVVLTYYWLGKCVRLLRLIAVASRGILVVYG